jgi:methylenetetrahydrofolate--tRNA-(uracil-5-)-methyltransferase
VVQLRKENLRADSYNLVGFQNHLKFGEQARVLRLIPGLENARFLRYGQIHRNTYIRRRCCWTKTRPHSAHLKKGSRRISSCLRRPALRRRGLHRIHRHRSAGGHLRGRTGARRRACARARASALGSLVHYITHADPKDFQPANITFDLLEPLEEELRKKVRDKKERHRLVCERALAAFDAWWASNTRQSRRARQWTAPGRSVCHPNEMPAMENLARCDCRTSGRKSNDHGFQSAQERLSCDGSSRIKLA